MVSTFRWTHDDARFGGLSGIVITDEGRGFVAISDRGLFLTGQIGRKDGTITKIETDTITAMRGPDGARLRDKDDDSEGLAIGADGRLHVSFEGTHGLRVFDGVAEAGSALIATREFAAMQVNSSLEALAIGPDGALYTLPERSGRATRPFPVFRLRYGVWDRPFDIPRRGAFLVAGADIGPDGRFYILERDFTGIGFRTRVRRFDLSGGNEETLLETAIATHDNLEGISVWRDASGCLRLTMVSDDNFRFLQQTEVVEYKLTD